MHLLAVQPRLFMPHIHISCLGSSWGSNQGGYAALYAQGETVSHELSCQAPADQQQNPLQHAKMSGAAGPDVTVNPVPYNNMPSLYTNSGRPVVVVQQPISASQQYPIFPGRESVLVLVRQGELAHSENRFCKSFPLVGQVLYAKGLHGSVVTSHHTSPTTPLQCVSDR